MSWADLGGQVRNVAFRKPPIGRRGYDDQEVDAFLDWLEGALTRGDDAAGIAARIHQVAFAKPPIGKHGYSEEEVDVFLDGVVASLGVRPTTTAAGTQVPVTHPGGPQPSALVEHPDGFLRRLFRR